MTFPFFLRNIFSKFTERILLHWWNIKHMNKLLMFDAALFIAESTAYCVLEKSMEGHILRSRNGTEKN